MIVQCMGGWCKQRDKCVHYIAPHTLGRQPVERLCGKVEEPETIKPTRDEQGASDVREAW